MLKSTPSHTPSPNPLPVGEGAFLSHPAPALRLAFAPRAPTCYRDGNPILPPKIGPA